MSSRAPKAAPGPSHEDRHVWSPCHPARCAVLTEMALGAWSMAFHGVRCWPSCRTIHGAGPALGQITVCPVCWIHVAAQGSGPGGGFLGPRWAGMRWLINHHTQRLRMAAHFLPGWRSRAPPEPQGLRSECLQAGLLRGSGQNTALPSPVSADARSLARGPSSMFTARNGRLGPSHGIASPWPRLLRLKTPEMTPDPPRCSLVPVWPMRTWHP